MLVKGLKSALEAIVNTEGRKWIETVRGGVRTSQSIDRVTMIYNHDEIKLMTNNTDYSIRLEHYENWEERKNAVRIYRDKNLPYKEFIEVSGGI